MRTFAFLERERMAALKEPKPEPTLEELKAERAAILAKMTPPAAWLRALYELEDPR
jgi:hypothetical protein